MPPVIKEIIVATTKIYNIWSLKLSLTISHHVRGTLGGSLFSPYLARLS
jgi:hypothetical protein